MGRPKTIKEPADSVHRMFRALRRRRMAFGVSGPQLSQALLENCVYRWEHGKGDPRFESLVEWCRALGLELALVPLGQAEQVERIMLGGAYDMHRDLMRASSEPQQQPVNVDPPPARTVSVPVHTPTAPVKDAPRRPQVSQEQLTHAGPRSLPPRHYRSDFAPT